MSITIAIDNELCIRCGKCVKVCPAKILVQEDKTSQVETVFVESCITCGHCVAVCPEASVIHSEFPVNKVHKTDYSQLPTPEQMMLLCKNRRSNRAFSAKPIPKESLDMILEAAHRAPTGSNAQEVKFLLVTNADTLRQITEFTMEVFVGMMKKIKNPLFRPIVKMIMPDVLKYIPVFDRLLENYAKGEDEILRKAKAVIFIYTPNSSRMGAADANLAYQNASLMAECLGVSQFYTGFVQNASQMKKGKLEKLLGVDGEIHAGMALAMPIFRYPNYVDRKEMDLKTIL